MPIVEITILEGREDEVIKNCIREVANTIHKELDTPLSTINVYVKELPHNRFSVGNKLKSD